MFNICLDPRETCINKGVEHSYTIQKSALYHTKIRTYTIQKSANNIQNNKNVWKKIDYLVLTFSKKIKKPYYKK